MGYAAAGAAVGVKHAKMLNHQVSLILGLRRAGIQGMLHRNTQGVLDLVNQLSRTTSEYETFKGARDAIIFRCWGQFNLTRDAALLDTMQTCIEDFDATKHWAILPFFVAATTELRGGIGDITGACALLDRALELVINTDEEWCAAEISRLQARFCVRDPLGKNRFVGGRPC